MSGRNYPHKLLSLLLLPVMISSCIYDDLPVCDEIMQLTIVNTWENAPQAAPEGMAYLFFPNGSIEPWRFDFPGRDAGTVNLPEGIYRFVMFNDDTAAIKFRVDDNGELEAYCREGNILEGLKGGIGKEHVDYSREKVEICPDMMWSEGYPYVNLAYDKVTYDIPTSHAQNRRIIDYDKVMRTYPARIIARYTYEIVDVANTGGIRRMCAAMSGLASSITLNDGNRSPHAVTLPFAASKQGDNAITGKFLTFGLPAPHNPTASPNILYLFIWLTDGKRVEYQFDVTGQVTSAPNPLEVHIKLSGLNLPEVDDEPVPGIFDPTVDGWEKIVINFES